MFRFSSKQLVIFGLIAIIGLGFFLRTYHFSDWLHFELDQARDVRVVDTALEGSAADLPLLGPKAGGTFLRLAPGFYYLEYLSALVFGRSPSGMASFVAVFSLLAIPFFYLLLRRYFSDKLSLGLTLLFAVSEYFVMYGRFAWNPNLLPFFVLLGFYALLRAVDHNETRRGWWFLVSVFALVFATHFHFLAFLALPTVLVAFLIIRRPKFSWKTWLGAIAITLVLYLPMALNEKEAGFANTEEFLQAITKKSNKSDHTLIEKAIRNVSEHALYGMVITTGFEGGAFPAIVIPGENEWVGWACDSRCDKGKWYGVAAVLIFGVGFLALMWFWWREKEQWPSDFLLLCGIWLAVTFGLFLPLAYDIAPRFFLLSGPLFFILLGLLFKALKNFFGERKIGRQIILSIILLLATSNLYFLEARFDELSRAGTEAIKNQPDRILKERIRVTLEQQNAIVDFLEERSRETGYPVYMFSEPQHRRALKYLIEKREIETAVLGFDGVYRQGVYYLILRAQSDLEDALKKYRVNYTVGETTSFGTLVAIELLPKPEAILGERQDFSKPKSSDSQAPPRYTWREFFERNATVSQEEEETSLDEMEDAQNNQ
ncbi:MAG: glycosyltransferase family 39 protein [bacterium]|nr:glycosyltransferase family 39 protein [bacterium]